MCDGLIPAAIARVASCSDDASICLVRVRARARVYSASCVVCAFCVHCVRVFCVFFSEIIYGKHQSDELMQTGNEMEENAQRGECLVSRLFLLHLLLIRVHLCCDETKAFAASLPVLRDARLLAVCV